MSLITRCPACGTLFKVVADQLKMSQGWVRCGQCAEVFDARGHMPGEESVSSAPAPLQADQTADHTADLAEAQAATPVPALTAPTPPSPPAADKVKNALDNLSLAPSTPSLAPSGKEDPSAGAIPASPVFTTSQADFADSDWYNTVNPPAPQAQAHLAGNFAAEPANALPSFVRQAQRAQRWRSPWVRALLLLTGAVLLTALGTQIALQERDRIAAMEPRALHWLQALCAVAGCTVEPFKHIEVVVVDASSFNKLRSDGKYELYKLALNLKNTGKLPVAVPHIELSLNDAQDQPVVRRVLTPADLGAAPTALAPAAELAGTSNIQVDASQLAGARIAGYRVWAFYP